MSRAHVCSSAHVGSWVLLGLTGPNFLDSQATMPTQLFLEKYTLVFALIGMGGCSSVGVDDGGEINEYKTGVFVACVNSHDSETDTDNYTWEYELTPTGGPEKRSRSIQILHACESSSERE